VPSVTKHLIQLPVAVVTGANRGIGYEVVRQLMGRGFEVVLGSRDPTKGQDAAQSLRRAEDRVRAVQLDVGDETSVSAMGAWVRAQFGRTDVLVDNAAIHYDT
jgi:NAD(P)-dependent dehydrogenase (short-subunit alcohol dehydrogenase family)